MKKWAILFFIIFGIALFAQQAKSDNLIEWEPIGPEGRNVVGMAVNPLSGQLFALVGESTSRLYTSDNSVTYWMTQRTTLNSNCYDIALNPDLPNIIYVLGKNGIFKSEDSGWNWTQYRFGNSSYGTRGQIAVNPDNSSIIYASGCQYYSSGRSCMAVFVSNDSGENWTIKAFNPGSTSKRGYTTCISVDPSDSDIVYCGGYFYDDTLTYHYKIYKSSDGGENWSDSTGSIDGHPRSIVVNPANPSNVFVGTTKGIFKSSNGGQTWQENDGDVYAYAIAIDPSDPNTLYAGSSNCFYKSVDGGENWTYYSESVSGSCNRLLASSSSPTKLFYGSNAGIYRSHDGGGTWITCNEGIGINEIPALAVASSSPNILYAQVLNKGIFKSYDFGTSWEYLLPDIGSCSSVIRIEVNPNDENDVFIYPGPAG